jgi:hypothetical protein
MSRGDRRNTQQKFGEAFHIFKKVFLTMTLGQRPLKICVLAANITNEFIFGRIFRAI